MIAPAPKSTSLIGLLRHGETVWNREKRIQGSSDSALTSRGIAQSRAWGRHLCTHSITWQRIIASPLERSRQTAALINESLQLPLVVEETIREQQWGEWEGLTLQHIKEQNPDLLDNLVTQGWLFRPPGGESRSELRQRVTAGLETIKRRWPNENILLVSHLGVIKALLYHIEKRHYVPEERPYLYPDRFHILEHTQSTLSIIDRNLPLPERL